jgi:1-acyl-sn-glycerol-3-phosphate acyltransferase
MMKILAKRSVPVIPMALQGMWGSFFSRIEGQWMKKPFRRGVFSKVGLVVAPAIPSASVTPEALHAVIADLRGSSK